MCCWLVTIRFVKYPMNTVASRILLKLLTENCCFVSHFHQLWLLSLCLFSSETIKKKNVQWRHQFELHVRFALEIKVTYCKMKVRCIVCVEQTTNMRGS